MDHANNDYHYYHATVIQRIKALMERKKIRQTDLVSCTDISQSSLSKLLNENGNMNLTLHHIFELCSALEIEPSKLLSLDTKIEDIPDKTSPPSSEASFFNSSYINDQILIQNPTHPAFNGLKNNTFHIYTFSTISSESFLLNGILSFIPSEDHSFCKAELILNTGKTDVNNNAIEKYYSGELMISLAMNACYVLLTNRDNGEICFLNFRHMFLFHQNLECRVGTISSTSSGGNRLPVIQRILLSNTPLKVSSQDTTDIDFIKGQLRLNHSEILISSDSLTALINAYENNTEILNFFKNFENLARKEEYLILDESSMREIPVASDIKTEGLGILRNASYAARYNKVSTKTDECIFDYICKKYKI